MKRTKKILSLILFSLIAFLAAGCGNTAENSKDQKSGTSTKITLTVSAAASLKDSMNEIKELYVKENANAAITYNFGASGTLQKQIEQGAPADIFMSAATKQMDELKNKNLMVNDTIKNLLQNDVVLVVPKDSTKVKSFEDLTSDTVQKIALGEPKSVPAGQYAEEVLTNLNILDKVKPKAVYGKDVKEVLTWVETGNADAGIVYKTDALVSDKVTIAATAPENSHKAVVYPVGVVKDSKNAEAAKSFLKFLSGDKAKAVFEKYGFKMGE
ncbi:molybdate ABC transporter substrate-binding protein [Clostridium kluyveri]|uniref:Molybdate ABC transporter substrate-binding protein n=1 Tax=Clostridium kluyveri TaxID=1534 RepID=A0A1L5FBF6_CLOKL|nr:molybdate ABC transporter substrate-binding protein [Clostridium kluyveri]APM40332.1 molybdate ABC transporter substrate-binding protein [Clostridium kluyveri]